MRRLCIINQRLLSIRTSSLSWKISLQQRSSLSTIGYVTDVEGNLDYWRRYVSLSKVLERDRSGQIYLKDGCQFVYGGDVCDRGSGCMHIMSDLISLKERYMDRVYLILGNRDINKLRIQATTHKAVLQCLPRTYWVKSPMEDIIPTGYKLGDIESKMKWTLARTMGAPISYEMRQLELQALGSPEPAWQSFLNWTDPEGGQLVRYLELGQLAARVGDVLFVHGAVHRHNVGWLPPTRETNPLPQLHPSEYTYHPKSPLLQRGQHIHSLDEWIYQLNAFVQSEISDYRTNIHTFLNTLNSPLDANSHVLPSGIDQIWDITGGYDHPQPGSRLLQYGMGRLPDGTLNPSVVYSSYMRQRPVPHKSIYAAGSSSTSTTTASAPSSTTTPTTLTTPAGTTTTTTNSSTNTSSSTATPSTTTPTSSGTTTSSSHKSLNPASTVVTEPMPIEKEAADYLRSEGVHRVVVGHQPVGDAPLFMQAHGVQMLSVDTAYSATVQWPASQLHHLYDSSQSSATTTPSLTNSSNSSFYSSTSTGSTTNTYGNSTTTATPASSTKGSASNTIVSANATEASEEEWCTAIQYMNTLPPQVQLQFQPTVSNVEKKSTRSPRAGFEVLLKVSDKGTTDKIKDTATSTATTTSSMSVSGYLSTGNYFHHIYPSPTQQQQEQVYDQTECGWRCRINNVQPTATSTTSTTNTTAAVAVDDNGNTTVPTYNLYSKVEGFTFKNKLLSTTAILDSKDEK